jgi:membrane protein
VPGTPLGRLAALGRGVVGRLQGVGLARTAAALSFTTLLGLVPLFTVGFVYATRYPLFQQWLEALERFLLRHLLPGSSGVVRAYLTEFTTKAANLKGVSLVLVCATAFLLVATIEREINAIWALREPRSLLRRAVVYGVGISAGPLLVGAAIYSTSWVLEATQEALPLTAHAIPFVAPPLAILFASLAFTLMYALVPARRVPMRYAAVGGFFAALAFEAAKRGFAVYIVTVPTYQVVYGALAVLPLFLLWIYVSWMIVLVGAAIVATLTEGPPRRRQVRR